MIALTAGAPATQRQRSLEAGINDVAATPLDPASLVRRLRARAPARLRPHFAIPVPRAWSE